MRHCAEDFRQINAIAPNAKKVWLFGNHDANLFEPNRIKPDLRPTVQRQLDQFIAENCEGWKVVQTYTARERFNVGAVTFQHGSAANVYSGRDQAVLYGSPYGLHVSGHTHRPTMVAQAMLTAKIGLPYWHANVGCLCDWDRMHYVQRVNISTWGHGCVVGETAGKIGEGRIAYHKRNWDAETRIFRMAA